MNIDLTISETEAKRKFDKLVERVNEKCETFIVTKKGKPEAVLISFDEYEELKEDLLLLSNKRLVREIREAAAEVKAGNFATYQDVFGRKPPKK